jgi:hypothetical protein
MGLNVDAWVVGEEGRPAGAAVREGSHLQAVEAVHLVGDGEILAVAYITASWGAANGGGGGEDVRRSKGHYGISRGGIKEEWPV